MAAGWWRNAEGDLRTFLPIRSYGGWSPQDQLQLCRAYAERQGWAVVATFQDAALSGFGVEHRPGYQ